MKLLFLTTAAAAFMAVGAFSNLQTSAQAAPVACPATDGTLSLYLKEGGPPADSCTVPTDPTEVAISLTNENDVTEVIGDADGVPVKFSSTEEFDSAAGNATITPAEATGTFSNITFSVPDGSFTDLIFHIQLADIADPPATDTSDFVVEAFNGAISLGEIVLSGLAPNTLLEFGLFSTSAMTSVVFSSTFKQMKSFEVSGLNVVPVPPAALLLLSGLVGLGFLSRSKRKVTA